MLLLFKFIKVAIELNSVLVTAFFFSTRSCTGPQGMDSEL